MRLINLIAFFQGFIGGGNSVNAQQTVAPGSVNLQAGSSNPLTCCELIQAGSRLKAAESLLLTPTPEAMREVEMLLGQALNLVKRLSKEDLAQPVAPAPSTQLSDEEGRQQVIDLRIKVAGFNQHCSRIAKLLEGARRVQWAHMRWINSFTQTYTAGATTSSWNPPGRTLNVEA